MVDWFPTVLDAAGVAPADFNRLGLSHLDGVSQWHVINGGDGDGAVTSSAAQPTASSARARREEFVYAINEVTGRAAIRWVQ